MDRNRELHELLGYSVDECEHEFDSFWRDNNCQKCNMVFADIIHIPDYTADPRLVLREMKERKDWKEFKAYYWVQFQTGGYPWAEDYVDVELMLDTTGRAADLVIEWLRERRG